LDRATDF